MEPRIQYCTTSDGVSIAYSTVGEGRPLIAMPVPGFSHAELSWQMFAAIFRPLAEKYHVIAYDSRGSGMSDRSAIDFSMDAMLRDLEAVIEVNGLDSFVMSSFISASPVAIRYVAENPGRASHLVIADGWADFADVAKSTAYRAGMPMLDADWVLFTETFAQVLWAYQAPEFGRLFAEFIRLCVDQDAMRAVWKSWETFDVREHLAQVTAPTLVVYNKNSRWFPVEVGQRLAASIPKARLALIDDITYAPVPDLIIEFVGEDTQPPKQAPAGQDSSFRTILFTDLVGHTEMMSRLGDEAGRDVLREHERITREVLKANGGTEVKTMGDGFMASFGSVTKAVECAVALQRAFADRHSSAHPEALEGLNVRVGLNAGEPIEEDGPDGRVDLFGATVILASRIAAKAEGGEILVADTVRGLCSGKGFLFSDRGEFVAKGLEEPVRVYEVSWRE
ncbi:MAG TPA: adenylate/guanylate cyclase domain-containing protein [Dehalococcoidia bacterium]|nr:adenylate/guanylate cyclase domain-containing protein [Dehalococcoidia bacterium]